MVDLVPLLGRTHILLQLVQFHKYVPEIAGGRRESASLYASQLAEVPGISGTYRSEEHTSELQSRTQIS